MSFGIENNCEKIIPGLEPLEQSDFVNMMKFQKDFDHIERQSVNDWETNGVIVNEPTEDSIMDNILQSSKFQKMIEDVVMKSHQRIRQADEERTIIKAATDQLERISKEFEEKIFQQSELERRNRKILEMDNRLKMENQRMRMEIQRKEQLIRELDKQKYELIQQSNSLSSNIEIGLKEVKEIGKIRGKNQKERYLKLETELQIDLIELKESIDWSPINISYKTETQRMKDTFNGLIESLDKLKENKAYREFLETSPQVERPEFRLF